MEMEEPWYQQADHPSEKELGFQAQCGPDEDTLGPLLPAPCPSPREPRKGQ